MRREDTFCDTRMCSQVGRHVCALCGADACDVHCGVLDLNLTRDGLPAQSLTTGAALRICSTCHVYVDSETTTPIYNDLLDDLVDSLKAARVEDDFATSDDSVHGSGDSIEVDGWPGGRVIISTPRVPRLTRKARPLAEGAACLALGHTPRSMHRCPNRPGTDCACCDKCEASCYLVAHGRIG